MSQKCESGTQALPCEEYTDIWRDTRTPRKNSFEIGQKAFAGDKHTGLTSPSLIFEDF